MKKKTPERLLIYGIGNVGRQDDGLGIRFIEQLEQIEQVEHIEQLEQFEQFDPLGQPKEKLGSNQPLDITFQSAYQLNVEDALEISEYDMVLFVDATVEKSAKAPFQIRKLQPSSEIAFSTHAMSMEGILALSDQLYASTPKAYVLTIPGYEWDISENMSEQAQRNLNTTVELFSSWLAHPSQDLQKNLDSLLL